MRAGGSNLGVLRDAHMRERIESREPIAELAQGTHTGVSATRDVEPAWRGDILLSTSAAQ